MKVVVGPEGESLPILARVYTVRAMLVAWRLFEDVKFLPTLWKSLVLLTTGRTDDREEDLE